MKSGNGTLNLVQRLAANPRYRGKHLIIIAGRVFAARSAAEATRLFDRLAKTHRRTIPTLLYVPRADALIVWLVG